MPIGGGLGDTGDIPVVPKNTDLTLLVFNGLNLKMRQPFVVRESFAEDVLRFPKGVEKKYAVPIKVSEEKNPLAEIEARVAKIDAEHKQRLEERLKITEKVDPERAHWIKNLQFI